MAHTIEKGTVIGDATFPDTTYVEQFEAPEDYHAFLLATDKNDYWRRSSDWGGDWNASINSLLNGNTMRLDQAEKLIDEMAQEQVFATDIPYYAPAVVGAYPNVPAYIIGEPLDMYAKANLPLESNVSPLTIYIETVVSGGLSLDELNKRGISCLAFAMAMNRVRPTQVYAVSCLGGRRTTSVISVKIASTPLDLGRAVFMLTDEGYARNLNFAASNKLMGTDDTGSWAWRGTPTDQSYINRVRAAINAEPQDVYIPAGYLYDTLMLDNPVKWVKQMIAKHGGTHDNEEG